MGTLNRERCRKCINSSRSTVGKQSYFSAVLTIAFLFFLSVLPFASALLFFFILFFLLVGKYYLYLLILSISKQSLKQGELLCDLVLTRCLHALLCSASHRKKEERCYCCTGNVKLLPFSAMCFCHQSIVSPPCCSCMPECLRVGLG